MSKSETIDSFYDQKFGWLPDNLKQNLGHFNVFHLDDYVGKDAKPIPYKRRDFYKITFFKASNATVHYADKSMRVVRQALAFSSPMIPYSWEGIESISGGEYCIFNQEFFSQFGHLSDYPVFKPGGIHVFELNDQQADEVAKIYQRMQEEINSNYTYKYDVLRTLVFELLHLAMKMQPSVDAETPVNNASQRVSSLFIELLERQFPLDELHQTLRLRTASDFAKQLNVHVNHLNRSLRETMGKTTTELIAERVLQEAKILLRQSNLTVSEIAYMLGFSEPARFNNFFKKYTQETPSQFRKQR